MKTPTGLDRFFLTPGECVVFDVVSSTPIFDAIQASFLAPAPRLTGRHSAAAAPRHRAPDTLATPAADDAQVTTWGPPAPDALVVSAAGSLTTAPRPLPSLDRPALITDRPAGAPRRSLFDEVGEGCPERRALPAVPAPCPTPGSVSTAGGSLVAGRSTRAIIDSLLSSEQMGAALMAAGSEAGPEFEQVSGTQINPVIPADRLRVSSRRMPEIAGRNRLPLPDRERGLLPRHTSLPPRPAEGVTSMVAAVVPDASTCMSRHTVRGTRCVHGLGHLPLEHEDMFGQTWGHGASRARKSVLA